MTTFTTTINGNHIGLDADLICTFEYISAERGERENNTGIQLEPDYAAHCILIQCDLHGVDISDVLNDNCIAMLEDIGLRHYE